LALFLFAQEFANCSVEAKWKDNIGQGGGYSLDSSLIQNIDKFVDRAEDLKRADAIVLKSLGLAG
jgi:hypothetical protein